MVTERSFFYRAQYDFMQNFGTFLPLIYQEFLTSVSEKVFCDSMQNVTRILFKKEDETPKKLATYFLAQC